MEVAEDCQISIFHYIKQKIFEKIYNPDNEKINKYAKRTREDLIAW